jgi:Flp pilus assembly pilin Flp
MTTTIRTLRHLAQQPHPEQREGQEGQSLVEYAVIILFVALAVVGALTLFGTSLLAYYENIEALLPF